MIRVVIQRARRHAGNITGNYMVLEILNTTLQMGVEVVHMYKSVPGGICGLADQTTTQELL